VYFFGREFQISPKWITAPLIC